jgi:hypothetical protein
MPPRSPHYISRNDLPMASELREQEQEDSGAQTDAVVPPVLPFPPVQSWLSGFSVYRVNGRSTSTDDNNSKGDGGGSLAIVVYCC